MDRQKAHAAASPVLFLQPSSQPLAFDPLGCYDDVGEEFGGMPEQSQPECQCLVGGVAARLRRAGDVGTRALIPAGFAGFTHRRYQRCHRTDVEEWTIDAGGCVFVGAEAIQQRIHQRAAHR
jgi:hypothetical protein